MNISLQIWRTSAILVVLAGVLSPAQTAQHTSAKRTVSLETLLSCADDPMIERVFREDREAALLGNFLPKTDPRYAGEISKNFNVFVMGDLGKDEVVYGVSPINPVSGKEPPETTVSFCHFYPQVIYKSPSSGDDNYPLSVSISGEKWTLNANEVFAHAEQFKFDSGVFNNSSSVYLEAQKGRTVIQFICTAKGPEFYRVIYMREETQ